VYDLPLQAARQVDVPLEHVPRWAVTVMCAAFVVSLPQVHDAPT
jgi:hypothetical protein